MRDIESPDEYVDWGFYHMISSALQRRVWMYSDAETMLPCSFSLYPGEYIILVGPPSTGKGRVIAQESAIIKSNYLLNPETKMPLIPFNPDKTTVESLTQHIAQNIKVCVRPHPKTGVKQSYGYCACSFLIEELEVLFAQNTNDMVSVLVHCYDGHDLHYKTKHQGEDKIVNICLSMIAGTTQDSLRDLMNSKILKKGMSSRCVFVYADKPRFFRQFPGLDITQQQALRDLTAHVKALTNVFGEIVLAPDAAEYHKKFYESGDMYSDRLNRDPRLDNYYGRKNIHWFKLAMTLLYSEQTTSNVITLEILKRAYNILRKTEMRMHEAFASAGRNALYESCMDIERALGDEEKISHRRLWWMFTKDLNKSQFEECMNLLVETGRVGNCEGYYSLKKTNTNSKPIEINGHQQNTITTGGQSCELPTVTIHRGPTEGILPQHSSSSDGPARQPDSGEYTNIGDSPSGVP